MLITPQLAGINRTELGSLAGSLADQRQTILAALDFLLTGFLSSSRSSQREKNALSAIIDGGGPIKVSFFGLTDLDRLPSLDNPTRQVDQDHGL